MYIVYEPAALNMVGEPALGNIFKKVIKNTIKFTQAVDPVSKVLSKTNIAKTTAGAILVPTAIKVNAPKPAAAPQPQPLQQTLVPEPAPLPAATSSSLDPKTKKILIYSGVGLAVVTAAVLLWPKGK